MKISELVKQTGVPKETIHYYIREGLLRKPRKSGINAAEYNEKYVAQLQLIKDLRDNYYLPIPIIKQVIKQSSARETLSQLHNKYFRPLDRLLRNEVIGREAFCEATGLGPKWLAKAEQWGVITPEVCDGRVVFSIDDIAIGKLMVDMDQTGFGPKAGFDPEDLKYIAQFVRGFIVDAFRKYYQTNLEKLSSSGFTEKGNQFHEIISLFFYHLYRKFARQAVKQLLTDYEKKEQQGTPDFFGPGNE